jgi:hypothetical protein
VRTYLDMALDLCVLLIVVFALGFTFLVLADFLAA